MKLILASASPRRKELLERFFYDFAILPSDVDETVPAETALCDAPQYLAKLKAMSVAREHPDAVVIGSDTGVFIDGKMLGKPKTADEARDMLHLLSGRTHSVISGCAVIKSDKCIEWTSKTDVTFYPLTDAEIDAYIATNEPMDKAGAYGIQGKGVQFVQKIDGDYCNVVGLPLAEVLRVLRNI